MRVKIIMRRIKLSKTIQARNLRREQTDVEKLLWYRLRNRQIAGVKFKRQFPVDDYIVDFVSLENNLIIELDGGQHTNGHIVKYDKQRTKYLETRGFKIIRFWNNEVLTNLEGVLECITLTLTLSLKGRGK